MIGMIYAAPAVVAVPILAVARALRRAKDAAEAATFLRRDAGSRLRLARETIADPGDGLPCATHQTTTHQTC